MERTLTICFFLVVALGSGAHLGWQLGRTIEHELRIKTWYATQWRMDQHYDDHMAQPFSALAILILLLLLTPFRWCCVHLLAFILGHRAAYFFGALRLRGAEDIPRDHQPHDEHDEPT